VLVLVLALEQGGGNSITNNLMFNWVRETSDHGNFNSVSSSWSLQLLCVFH
jgi:hypothetical protein